MHALILSGGKPLTMYAFQQQEHLVDDHMVRYVLDHELLTV